MIDRQTGYDDSPEPPECVTCPNPVNRDGDYCTECLECLRCGDDTDKPGELCHWCTAELEGMRNWNRGWA